MQPSSKLFGGDLVLVALVKYCFPVLHFGYLSEIWTRSCASSHCICSRSPHLSHLEYAQRILSATRIWRSTPVRRSTKSFTSSRNSLKISPGRMRRALSRRTWTSQRSIPWSLYDSIPFSVGIEPIKIRSTFLTAEFSIHPNNYGNVTDLSVRIKLP